MCALFGYTIRAWWRYVGSRMHRKKGKRERADGSVQPQSHHVDRSQKNEDEKIPDFLEYLIKGEAAHLRRGILAALVGFRVINALVCTTAFVPDEYWQSLEVAHRMTFGYGYLTWEWQKALRGYTHPLIFAALYKLLALLHLDWPRLLIILPRVMQALLAAVGNDFYVFKLSSLMFGKRAGFYALLCNLVSWFTFYCVTRTLSNSFETALTPAVLYYWTLACEENENKRLKSHTRVYLVLAAVSCLVRPTGAILCLPLVLIHVTKRFNGLWTILREVCIVGLLVLCWSLAVDWYFYRKVVLVQLNFLLFNVIEGQSSLFGTHSWHWYFLQGVPVVLFTSLPLCLLGAWHCPASRRTPFWLSLVVVAVHSCLGHKEFRFVFPIVPVGSIYAGFCVMKVLHQWRRKAIYCTTCLLLLAHIPMALYFSCVHQRGTVALMDVLREDITANSSVLFLMPCHSTPYYSHIHREVKMKFLECPPPIDPSYEDTTEVFYDNPELWLHSNYQGDASLPSHLVMYDTLMEVQGVDQFIADGHYKQVAREFHTHLPDGGRCGTYILMFRKA